MEIGPNIYFNFIITIIKYNISIKGKFLDS